MVREGWPGPVRNLAELRALAEELANEFHDAQGDRRGEWSWNGYSCIMAPVPKGHVMDASITFKDYMEWGEEPEEGSEPYDDTGYAVPIHIEQTPNCAGGGDELHHPIPRKVAAFVEVVDPAFIIQLIDGTANKLFDEALLEENEFLRKRLAQAEMWITHYRNELREKGIIND